MVMIIPYLCCGSREMIFLTMSASPSLLILIEFSSLITKFKQVYMSLTSLFSFIAKELYSFKTRQCLCSRTLDVPS
jgi:predicted branched-subunit amino acid permease